MNNTLRPISGNHQGPVKVVPASFLNSLRLPARLNREETAAILGFRDHDIPVLERSRLLKPLGGGVRNCVKYFAAVEIEKLSKDRKWLDRATTAISRRKVQVEGVSNTSRQSISHLSSYAS